MVRRLSRLTRSIDVLGLQGYVEIVCISQEFRERDSEDARIAWICLYL